MKHFLLILALVPFIAFSQDLPRQLLTGQVLSDSLGVGNVTVENASSKIIAKTNNVGKFTLYVKEQDTLLFYADSFLPVKLVVDKADLETALLRVRIQKSATALDEVVVYRVKLSGNLDADSKKIKTLESAIPNSGALYDRDYGRGTELVNIAMPEIGSPLTGIDFVRIGGTILGWLGLKSAPKKKPLPPPSDTFAEIAQQKFSYHFFTQTLKIEHDRIGLFLSFCDTPDGKMLLHPDKEFELTDYLIKKSAEFKLLNKQ